MAGIGLRYSAYAPLTEDEDNGTFSYGAGKRGRKMIKADLSLNISDTKVFSDDNVGESAKEFVDGTLTLNQDDLTNDMRKDLLGNTVTSVEVGDETVEELASNDEDLAPAVGFAYIQSKIIDKVRQYRAVFYPKVQFGEPNESAETKGQQINWQTPVIIGTIMRRNDGNWKEEITVPSLATAIAWIKQKTNLT